MSESPGVAPLDERLVAFAGLLRARGVAVAPERVADALLALRALDPRRPRQGYWALRCVFATRHEDLARFDRAFAETWGGLPPPLAPTDPADGAPAEGDEGAGGEAPAVERDRLVGDDASSGGEQDEDAEEASGAAAARSAHERLRTLDFAAYGPEDLRRARRAMEQLARALPRRVERRLAPARARGRLDVRRTLLDALHTDGVPLRRAWRAPRRRPFKLVLVLDVSGSMAAYAQALLTFAHAAVHADRRVEAFTFGTRLTRVTPALAQRHPDRALDAAARLVPDWFSGTRIGENLATLNERWGRRGVTRGALVVILSDGWERGDPGVLAAELAQLRRSARRLLWVNPLAGHEGYAPLAAGMAAALPHVDRLLPGHDLAALEGLVDAICALTAT